MSVSRTGAAVFGASTLGLGLLTVWVAVRQTPAGIAVLALGAIALSLGGLALGLVLKTPPRDADAPYVPERDGFFRRGRTAAGRLRTAGGLAFAPAMAIWTTWNLTTAATRGLVYERNWISLAENPFGFWFNVAMNGVVALLFYGLAGMALYGLATQRRSVRKIDAYLRRRAEEGSRTSAVPRQLR